MSLYPYRNKFINIYLYLFLNEIWWIPFKILTKGLRGLTRLNINTKVSDVLTLLTFLFQTNNRKQNNLISTAIYTEHNNFILFNSISFCSNWLMFTVMRLIWGWYTKHSKNPQSFFKILRKKLRYFRSNYIFYNINNQNQCIMLKKIQLH